MYQMHRKDTKTEIEKYYIIGNVKKNLKNGIRMIYSYIVCTNFIYSILLNYNRIISK